MVDRDPFHKNLGDMLVAAARCVQLHQHVPALVLMYTLIDSLAWASIGETEKSVRKRFEAWVDTWLLPELRQFSASVTSSDIYAARCAVLHTLTGSSDMSDTGRARRIMYAWGTGRVEVLEAALQETDDQSHVALHYDDLQASLFKAVDRFLDAANADVELEAALDRAAAKHYTYIEVPTDHEVPNG